MQDIELDLHFTNKCNIKCKHCLYESGKDIGEVPIEKLIEMIREFATLGLQTIHIGGGEPLCRYNDLLKLVDVASELGIISRLVTNGYMITEKNLKELVKYGLKELLVSIDGTEEYHNNFRNVDDGYKRAINAITIGSKLGLYIKVNSVLTTKNFREIKELMKITTKIPVNTHAVLLLTPIGRGKNIKNLTLNFEQIEKFIGEIQQFSIENNITDTKLQIQRGYSDGIKGNHDNYCRIDSKCNALIYSTGNVFPCVMFSQYGTNVHEEFSLGNINTESIIDIWGDKNDRWNKYKRKQFNRNSNCKEKLCDGGCRGYTNEINECDYRCDVNSNKHPTCFREYSTIENKK